MLTVYVICAIVGGGLILLTAMGGVGEHDHDIGHDGTLDGVDTQHGELADAGSFMPFLSLRFWTYTLGIFGIAGLLLHFLFAPALVVELALAGASGVVSGLGVSYAVHRVQKTSVDSGISASEMLGSEATVLLPMHEAGETGKIRIRAGHRELDMLAIAEEGGLHAGEPVAIIEIRDGRARVVRANRLLSELQNESVDEVAVARRED